MKKCAAPKQTDKSTLPPPSLSAAAELAVIARTVDKLKADPKALQGLMQRAGIVTENGKLTKEFGG
ncbi:MAG: hypothetical protein EOM92_07785 [Gammaproteobacteria bacterium]|jgi:hypothetical protein|nr:hypothetical protein [Gammaproteobacteria bacterium]